MAYIDGETGLADPAPGNAEITLTNLKAKYDAQQKRKALLQTMKGQEDVTLDGKHIKLYCNIGSPRGCRFRSCQRRPGHRSRSGPSSSTWLRTTTPPRRSSSRLYKKVAEAMDGKRVIIRTLDIGADKQVAYFNMPKEENPAMGIRAIRGSPEPPRSIPDPAPGPVPGLCLRQGCHYVPHDHLRLGSGGV